MNSKPKPDIQPPAKPQERLIELGWLLVGRFQGAERKAIDQARARMLEQLQQAFGRFEWRMPVVERDERPRQAQEEPADLLQLGIEERDRRHWDFIFVLTQADLKSYYKPFALAVPSRAVGVAVLSTARLSPQPPGDTAGIPVLAGRVWHLGMHLLGDLNGIPHSAAADAYMYEPQGVEDLDAMARFSEAERETLAQALAEVADLRLEERSQTRPAGPLAFHLKAAAIGARDIGSAVVQAKPWEFPLRFSRLTAAALSALMVLIMTAEVWDLGMGQPLLRVGLLSLLVLAGTTAFLVKRQGLLLQRGRQRLTEQIAIANVSIGIVVLLGMLTTYLMLFMLTLLLSSTLYSAPLVAGWAASLNGRIGIPNYLALAGFVASLGIVIGSLGASFEGRQYFRHITYADEET